MDWLNVEPDVYRLINKHYTPGRGGQKIKYIVRHHNAGVLTIDGCWQVWQTRPASAHYQVENSGRIGQLVNDSDTAWHAANQLRNQQSIGIEHANCGGANQDWPISDTVIKQGARLAAALCRYYRLGRPEYGKNIKDHRETGQTSCPYHLAKGGKYHNAWMAEAQRFYDELTRGKTPKPAPKPAPKPQPKGDSMTDFDQINRRYKSRVPGSKVTMTPRDALYNADAHAYLILQKLTELEQKIDNIAKEN
ncbi:N-acetylmuramoyl-L-alanine amidase [Corynebacterium macclintockiae]|uniref:N-acetylmuramoyl-L-alanine amidase n=1 Tax=Corynebacterium macclintockiae TaxID=2913501 RepID=UPI003EB83FCA